MKSKNSVERRNSILKFALLFIVTTALIVVTFFFDFDRILFKENEVLRERAIAVNKDIAFQKEFSEGMKKIKGLIDSLDTQGQDVSFLAQIINKDIADLQRSIPTEDDTYRYDMYTNIINSYLELKDTKIKMTKFKGVDETILQYKTNVLQLKNELNACERRLDSYQLSSQ
ncbi:hypothetical protein GCM10022393_32110 [Aquimarina addita]|uniref:Type VI secretion system transmembrane protein TssO n=1 Tax=Aquimarina addita TaxID=870485 RepID=A0ABP6URM0_9FLAO